MPARLQRRLLALLIVGQFSWLPGAIGQTTTTTVPPTELLPGRVAVVRPSQFVRFLAKPAAGDTFALPTANPITDGGTLHVFDTVESPDRDDTYLLPSGGTPPFGWRGLGNPPGSKGYRYKGTGAAGDPCRVLIKPTVIKATCKGAGVNLTPPFTNYVGIVLSLGATDSYCARFGGFTHRNDGTVTKRTDAGPPPIACPTILTPPLCGLAGSVCAGSCEVYATCVPTASFGCQCATN